MERNPIGRRCKYLTILRIMQENIENNTKTIHRLSEYITNIGISFNKLALELGLSNSYFSKMVKNGGSVGSDIIENILRIHPDLNANWLFTGEGSMFRDDQHQELSRSIHAIQLDTSSGEAAAYYRLYEKKDEENKVLLKEVGRLEAKIRQLEADDLGGKTIAKSVSSKKHSSQDADNATSANVQ